MARGSTNSKRKQAERAEKVQIARVTARTEVIVTTVPWIGRALMVAAAWVPLQAITPMVEELAGKNTDVGMSFSVSIVANFFIGGAYFVERAKNKRQKQELQRLRGRLEQADASVVALPEKRGSR